ncbi:MAG: DUF1905 domain-containing protein [Candidatus Dojkabacteria bacterium]|nr:MAG: DUF1905 domain-containing protein [Candidatus Dojkabacteria bacterium]
MSAIQFKAKAYKPENAAKSNKDLLLLLPQSASDKLPSRGMALVEGTINGTSFKQPLEPNGEGSHLVVLDLKLQKETGIKAGDIAALSIEPSKDWPEPRIPADLKRALDSNKGAINTWKDITPMALGLD